MIVVAVLMTNCQVSLKLKIGPVIIQARIVPTAIAKTIGRPQNREDALANLEYHVICLMCVTHRIGFKNSRETMNNYAIPC